MLALLAGTRFADVVPLQAGWPGLRPAKTVSRKEKGRHAPPF
jgi:hypothetical protein